IIGRRSPSTREATMNSADETHSDRDARVDEVLADYLQALQAGRAPGRSALLAAHPDLATELAEFLDDQEGLGLADPPPGPAAGRPGCGELEEVGRGGMGVVYRGRDPRLGRALAVKVLLGPPDPERVRRFVAEAEITGRLEHPGVVAVHGLGESPDGRPVFTLKLVHGRTPAQLLQGPPHPTPHPPQILP